MFSFLFLHDLSPALSQAEEKKVSEKTLQAPLLPSPVADHVKCNILKAQLENASRVNAQVRGDECSLNIMFQEFLHATQEVKHQSRASMETGATSWYGSLDFILFFNYILFLCGERCRGPCWWRSEDHLRESALAFCRVGPKA